LKELHLKLGEDIYEFIFDWFKNAEIGAHILLEGFHGLFMKTLRELKGTFERNELYLIMNVFEGLTLNPADYGGYLEPECLDAFEKDLLDIKWDVDDAAFLKKLKTLTVFQKACLEIWASAYWYGGGAVGAQKTDTDLERHVAQLMHREQNLPEPTD
jgi:hypothetical protein